MKPNFFGSRESFDAAAEHDGFYLEGEPGRFTLHGRIEGTRCQLQENGDAARFATGGETSRVPFLYNDGMVRVVVEEGEVTAIAEGAPLPATPHRIDMGRFHTLVALLRGITDATRIHPINTRLITTTFALSGGQQIALAAILFGSDGTWRASATTSGAAASQWFQCTEPASAAASSSSSSAPVGKTPPSEHRRPVQLRPWPRRPNWSRRG